MINKLLLVPFLLLINITFSQVSPFISTTWNQGCYYNNLMPTVSSGGACTKAYTGCNATAIAQIFKYYNYPTSGMGSHCNTNNATHCTNYDSQTYNYSLMPNNVTAANAEVAKLMYHIGIGVDMQWTGTSSDSYFSSDVFKRYFKYSPKMYASATYLFATTADLVAGIKAELEAGRPVFAKGGNHFYLIDGYNTSNQFHCNFGWGGTHNGYYAITNIVNGAGNFTPVNFLFNIKPMTGTLEVATETINLSSGALSSNTLEFTSTSNWNATTNVPWITLNIPSGTSGYFSYSDNSTFSTLINNGDARTGQITITNGIETKIITVNQEASALGVSTLQLDYTSAANSQPVTTTWFSWSAWNATTSESWITIDPTSGTGNATINATCLENTLGTSRTGSVYINGGSYTRTITVNQEASALSITNYNLTENSIYPNPTNDKIYLNVERNLEIKSGILYDLNGRTLLKNVFMNEKSASISHLESGIYFLQLATDNKTITKKIVLK